VAEYGIEPYTLAMKWKTPSRLIDQITETIARFPEVGVTRVEVMPWPPSIDSVERLGPVFTALAND